MYTDTKSSLKRTEGIIDDFTINRGVRQDASLSPTLFKIYINDMTELFINSKCDPLSLENSCIGSLMFADDLLVLSESNEGLQESLNKFSLYCKE